MAPPPVLRQARWVVVGEVVDRQLDRPACRDVALILLLERRRIVFEMVDHVERPMIRVLDQTGPGRLRSDQRPELRMPREIPGTEFRPAAYRHHETVGEAIEERRPLGGGMMAEATEGLPGQHMFRHAPEMVQHRHPAPAHADRVMDVGLRPVEDLRELVPVGDILVGQVLDRRAGDDQPVELALARHLERQVERLHMLGRGVPRLVPRHPDQRELDLQGRRADQPGELRLRRHLLRHQVEQRDLQRPDVLPARRLLAHHHHALAPEDLDGRQGFGDLDRHSSGSVGCDPLDMLRGLAGQPEPVAVPADRKAAVPTNRARERRPSRRGGDLVHAAPGASSAPRHPGPRHPEDRHSGKPTADEPGRPPLLPSRPLSGRSCRGSRTWRRGP